MHADALKECIVFLEKVNLRISMDYNKEIDRGKSLGLIL